MFNKVIYTAWKWHFQGNKRGRFTMKINTLEKSTPLPCRRLLTVFGQILHILRQIAFQQILFIITSALNSRLKPYSLTELTNLPLVSIEQRIKTDWRQRWRTVAHSLDGSLQTGDVDIRSLLPRVRLSVTTCWTYSSLVAVHNDRTSVNWSHNTVQQIDENNYRWESSFTSHPTYNTQTS